MQSRLFLFEGASGMFYFASHDAQASDFFSQFTSLRVVLRFTSLRVVLRLNSFPGSAWELNASEAPAS